jgi:hypothetical protein
MGAERNAEWVIFIEDDVAFIKHFVDAVADWLDDHATEQCRIYAFGAACIPNRPADHQDGTQHPVNQARGEWEYPARTFMGTQCIGFRQADTIAIIDGLTHYHPFNKTKHGYDCELRRWAEKTWGSCLVRCTAPSFVQHVGSESAIHSGRMHTYPSWPGPDWTYTKRPKTVQFVSR